MTNVQRIDSARLASASLAAYLLSTTGAQAAATAWTPHGPSVRRMTQPVRPAHGWLSDRARAEAQTRGLVFVASATQNLVTIFSRDDVRTPIGQITDGLSSPQGLATDHLGNLYVANSGNNTVTIYPAGTIHPTRTISNGLDRPGLVAVGYGAYVYVANGNASVVGYAPGATSPSVTLTLPNSAPAGLAVGPYGDAYVGWSVPASEFTEDIYRYPRGSSIGTNTGISVASDVDPPSAIAVDQHENVLVCDDGVSIYPKGSTQANHYLYGGFDTAIAVDRDGHVYVVDNTFGAVFQKTYPDGNDTNTIENYGYSAVAASSKPMP